MALLRSTVFLLIACAVLTQTLADFVNTEQINDGNAEQIRNDQIHDGNTEYIPRLSDPVPACAADYAVMNRLQPKLTIKALNYPAGICVKPNGDFVAAVWAVRTYVYMFNNCGWIKKRIELPKGTSLSADCAFTSSNMFYSAIRNKKILQFNANGTYQKEFTTGFNFLRLATRGNELYSTVDNSKDIRVYDTRNGNIVRHFTTTRAMARGLAFDRSGYLHVSTLSKYVEIFTYDGHKVQDDTFPDLVHGDGLVIDGSYYTIITDRAHRQLQVYNENSILVKKITGFGLPMDVAMGYKCGYVILADYSAHSIYLL